MPRTKETPETQAAVEAATEGVTVPEEPTGEKVKLFNPDVRGVSLVQANGTSLFIGPKQRVTIDKSQMCRYIREALRSGLIEEE